jgi:hypothetical protein
LPDGSIPQVEMTSCGLNGGPLEAKGTYPSVICCNLTNGHMPQGQCVDTVLPHIICKNDERFISEIEDGTLIGYKYFDFDGSTQISIKYRTCMGAPRGKILAFAGENLIGEIEITDTPAWKIVKSGKKEINGTYPLYLRYEGNGYIDIIEFSYGE